MWGTMLPVADEKGAAEMAFSSIPQLHTKVLTSMLQGLYLPDLRWREAGHCILDDILLGLYRIVLVVVVSFGVGVEFLGLHIIPKDSSI
jgi:hypothetical protein